MGITHGPRQPTGNNWRHQTQVDELLIVFRISSQPWQLLSHRQSRCTIQRVRRIQRSHIGITKTNAPGNPSSETCQRPLACITPHEAREDPWC